MFKTIRALLEALQEISRQLRAGNGRLELLIRAYDQAGPLADRLEALERSREGWEAATEAQLVRGETEFKKARAAEERAKTVLKNAEALNGGVEGEEEGLDNYLELLASNVGAGEVEALPAVPVGLAVSNRSAALNAKFGRNI